MRNVKRSQLACLWAAVALIALGAGGCGEQSTTAQQDVSGTVLPRPEQPFAGKVGRTVPQSFPHFPAQPHAPQGAPNVVLILTDDAGFGSSSAFGGPVQTPTFERVAEAGLRYNAFHTTALCSPTRAALITGRNHHTCATGVITEMATGFPGYNSLMSKSCGTIAEILKQNGYNTAWFGKNHNVPDWQTNQTGPFDLWPTGLGFEYFYGFIGGDTDQWHPALFEGTKPIETPPHDPHYILDHDLADHAVEWIREQNSLAPDKPFFLYYATGTSHAPHHAPKEWIAKYKGQFDQGWDQVREQTLERQKKLGVVPENTRLTARPAEIPAWDSLSTDQKKVYARMMEVYAGALSYCDNQIGRVLDAVAETGELDNTIVIYIMGDNGASAEGSLQGTTDEVATNANGAEEDIQYLVSMMDELGGPKAYNHYPVGWAHAMDTPFQWTKQVASHFGGTRNGMVISWPKRIKDVGTVRRQFCHVIDVAPTILEAVGLPQPGMINGIKQKPIEGTSLVYSLDDAKAPTRHSTQYFELVGNRGIYHDGWVACTTPLRLPWVTAGAKEVNPGDFKWELYHVAEDFSESKDLAADQPEKLKELQGLFDAEAAKYNVLPLDASFIPRFDPSIRPSVTRGRTKFTYYPGMIRIPEGSTPDVKNKSYSVTADVDIPRGGANGVLATQGGRFGGWALLMMNNRPLFVHALSNQARHKYFVRSAQALTPGKHIIRFDFDYDGGGSGKGGTGTLLVDDQQVAKAHIERTVGKRFSLDETFDVGSDTGTPVIEDYESRMPFTFSGTLEKLTIELKEGAVAHTAALPVVDD